MMNDTMAAFDVGKDAGVIGTGQKCLNTAGGWVDALFLSLPGLIKPFLPRPSFRREDFERELDFYFREGYADNPRSFFRRPEKIPHYTVSPMDSPSRIPCELISFESAYRTVNPLVRERFEGHSANRTGYLIRWAHGDPGRKTVLCLHGFMLGEPAQAEKMFQVRRLFDAGLDVALFITPFHWRRAPQSPFMRGIFLQPGDPAMTGECFGQAMHDLHISFGILRDLGAGEIGLAGASLGGYNAALFISLCDEPAFAALIVPAVNMSRPFGVETPAHAFKTDTELMMKARKVWELHSPLHLQPRIDRDHILIVASRGDRLCPFDQVIQLCEKWDWPRHRFLTGGHWLIFNNRLRGRAWYSFLRDRGFMEPGL